MTKRLSKDLNTTVSIKHIDLELFNRMSMEGLLVLDHKKDTLLYAGAARVNLTDWFFFKDNITLNYIGLDDAIVNMNRKDSVWNYQFLVDYFSSPKSKDTTAGKPIHLDLKKLRLRNIKFWQKDEWRGENMLVSIGDLNLKADLLDLENKEFRITSIDIEKPLFTQYDYEGLRPPSVKSSKPDVDLSEDSTSLQWNTDGWHLLVKNISLKNGGVSLDREGRIPAELGTFDEQHIILSEINGQLKNLEFIKDSLKAKVTLSVKDRSGFVINKLSTDYKLTPKMMEFANLDLVTPRSHLTNYYAMHYQSFSDDMSDFIHAVKLEGHFKNSKVSSADIAFFAPELQSWKKVLNLNLTGDASGTIDNISAKNMIISAGENNYLDGDISMKGLPDIDETFIDFDSRNLKTSYSELVAIIPALKGISQPQLSALGKIQFIGNYTGFIRDFVTYGTLNTDIGFLKTDLHLQVPEKGIAKYSGTISTDNFQLGRFIDNKQIGNISFDGKINGQGFSENDIQLAIDGDVSKVAFNGYAYQNIIAHGEFNKKVFTGSASIHDPNLIIDSLNGSINFSKTKPTFNLEAQVSRLNLRDLGYTKDTTSLTGDFNLDFTGSNIDNFLGSAKLYNAVLMNNGQRLSFDSLNINSSVNNNSKLLTIETNELSASINGNFKILDLPDAFQLFLNKYYPAYIKKPENFTQNQDFTFHVKTGMVSDYLNLFNKKLTGFDESTINGKLNVAENTLDLQVVVPQFNYANISFNNIQLTGTGTKDTLSLIGDIADVIINDSLHSPGTKIKIVAANDISDVDIIATGNKAISAANFSARIQTRKDGFILNFNPSNFTLNQKKWVIQKDGQITLDKKFLMAENVRLSQDNQEISISTEPSGIGNFNDVIVSLKNIVLEDITPLVLKTPKLSGLLTGSVKVEDPFGNAGIAFNTRIDQFRFENDSIGVLNADGNFWVATESLKTHVVSDNELYKFKANLSVNPKDSMNQVNGSVIFDNSGIHILEEYLGGIFSKIYGRATGTLNLGGTVSDPKLTGKISLKETTLTVDYTKCRYILADNSVITFNPDNIDFGNIRVIDTLNNTATLTGKISHKFFDEFYFNNLHLVTDEVGNNRGRFILLNTTSSDNNQFYGNMIGRADLNINGPVTDMVMNISGEPTDSSHIYLPIGETAETGTLDYIEFTRFGREMKADLKVRESTNIKVNMEITANPLAKIDVIMDETTGDVIKAQGSGKLIITAGTRDPLTIRGRYDIEEGEYTFNFQTFLKTPFTLQQGYIEWQGDPYLAILNIDAIYKAENVILNNIPTASGIANTRGEVDIIFKLRGTLKDPHPGFEFQFPFTNPLKSDPIANEYLKTRYQSDNNQLLNQVASLLLFNTFMNNDQGLLTGNNTGNFVTKSVGQLLSATLSSSLNNWLQKLLNTNSVNLYTNLNTSDFNFEKGGSQREIQNVGNFGFKTAFLNNKLLVTVGGNLDYTLNSQIANSNSNFLFTPDVSFEYLITPDGRFRVVGFNRSDADPGDISGITRRNRTGIQLSYRKDFDTFQEFFTNTRKRRRK